MALSLLDAINQNQQKAQQPQDQQNQTQGIASLLRAKSGKSGAGPSTALSNQQELGANAQTNTGLTQAVQAGALQNQGQQTQSAGIEQQQQAQMQDVSQQRQAEAQKAATQTAQTLQNLQQNKGKISQDEYTAQMEQVGQNLRLTNQQYVDQLNREGDMQRLNQDLNFKEQLQQATFGDQSVILQNHLKNRSIVDATENEYKVALQELDIKQSYEMFQSAMDNEKDRAMWTAASGMMSAGIGGMAGMGGGGGKGGSSASGASNKYNNGSAGGPTTMPGNDYSNTVNT